MRPSLHLFFIGVGAFIAFGNTAVGLSETVPQQSQDLAPTNSPWAAPSQKRLLETEKISSDRPPTVTAQATPTPPSGKPTPTPVPPATGSPLPNSPAPDLLVAPSTSKPIGPAKAGRPPEYLNVSPNPLQFPTKPEEVKLRGVQPITLKQALELAERNNRGLEAQKLQMERSRAALVQAQAALYPQVNFQGVIGRSASASSNLNRQLAGSNASIDSNNITGNFNLSYDIYTSGKRPAQIKAAEKQLRSDELQVEITREQLRLDVTGTYYDLQQADENVRINQAAVRNNQISLRDANALERAGLGTRFDVLRSEVQLANSRQQLTNAIAQQKIQRRQLAQRLNLPETFDLVAADPVELVGTWNLPLEESIVLAYKNRAELEQQLVLREQYQQLQRAAIAALGPTVSLSAQYQLLKSLDTSFGVVDGYSVSANVSWTLFDGGAAAASARQQELNAQSAAVQFANQRDQVRFQIEQAYATLNSSFENIDTTTKALEQAKEALRLARLRFQAGVGTQSDVINAETDLTTAEGNRVTAILGVNRAIASLQRYVSNLPPGVVGSVPPGSTSSSEGLKLVNSQSSPTGVITLPAPTSSAPPR